MFERFSTQARAVVVHAQEQARELQHTYIGTEHILLALYAIPDSVAAHALREVGLGRDQVLSAVDKMVGRGDKVKRGHIPFTPRAKKVLELSLREALHLKVNYIGAEHILLGLIREGEGVAAQSMTLNNVPPERLRATVLELIEAGGGDALPATPTRPSRSGALEDVLSAAEALAGGAPVGSHHLLEALVLTEGSMAAKVLADLGVQADAVAGKLDELDPDDTTDATPEESAARRMELRVDADEVHVVLRDPGSVDLARAVVEQAGGPLVPSGPLAGVFVPLWAAVNSTLITLHRALQADEDPDEGAEKASTLVRRVLQSRLRRRGRG